MRQSGPPSQKTQATTLVSEGRIDGWFWKLEVVRLKPFAEWSKARREQFERSYAGREIVDGPWDLRLPLIALHGESEQGDEWTVHASCWHVDERFAVGAGVFAGDEDDGSPALLFGVCDSAVSAITWAGASRGTQTTTTQVLPAPYTGRWFAIRTSASDLQSGFVAVSDSSGGTLGQRATSRVALEGSTYLRRRRAWLAPVGQGALPDGEAWQLFAVGDLGAVAYALADGAGRDRMLCCIAVHPEARGVEVHPTAPWTAQRNILTGVVARSVHEVRAEHEDGSRAGIARVVRDDWPLDLVVGWSLTGGPLGAIAAIDADGEVINRQSGRARLVRPT
jgi:hypothetical protein